jgi:hypothetical protein
MYTLPYGLAGTAVVLFEDLPSNSLVEESLTQYGRDDLHSSGVYGLLNIDIGGTREAVPTDYETHDCSRHRRSPQSIGHDEIIRVRFLLSSCYTNSR